VENIVSVFLLGPLLASAYTLAIYNFKIIKISYKESFICTLLYYISFLVAYFVQDSIFVPMSLLMILMYLLCKNKNIYGIIISIFFSILILNIADIISGFTLMVLLNKNYEYVTKNLVIMFIVHILIICIVFFKSRLVGRLGKRFGFYNSNEFSNKSAGFIVMIIGINAIIVYLNINIAKKFGIAKDKYILSIYLALFIIYMLINLIVLYVYSQNMKKIMEVELENREYKNLAIYTSALEGMVKETKRFKHDYVNVLNTINGYIKEEDVRGLRSYFANELLPESNKVVYQNDTIAKLQHIKFSGLKGLLSSKFIEAQARNINVYCNLQEDITEIDMGIFDLCRIMGIIVDNAIEAALESEIPEIGFRMFKKEGRVIIVLKNNYGEELPPIHKMFEEGFSKKENHSGIGLSTVRKLIDEKYSKVQFSIRMEDNYVRQELYI
jgi:two-component system sensor histidine kinase AgrC